MEKRSIGGPMPNVVTIQLLPAVTVTVVGVYLGLRTETLQISFCSVILEQK